jgi:hypothetical protein
LDKRLNINFGKTPAEAAKDFVIDRTRLGGYFIGRDRFIPIAAHVSMMISARATSTAPCL